MTKNNIVGAIEVYDEEVPDGYARVFVEIDGNIYPYGMATSISKKNQNGYSAIISLCVGACVVYKYALDLKIYVLFRKDGELNLAVYETDENFSDADIANMKQQFQEEMGGVNELFNEKSCRNDKDKPPTMACL